MKLTAKLISRVSAAVIVLFATVTIIPGCNTSGCTDNRSSIPLAGFYSATTGTSISLDSLDVMGAGAPTDSLMLAAGTRATEVYLPLRSDSPSVTYDFTYKYKNLEGITDRLTISYESYPYFASEECGAMYRYRITRIEHTDFLLDSVALTVPDSVITNVNIQSMKLFFRTN